VSITTPQIPLTEEQKRELNVYLSGDNLYYHGPGCYTIQTALKNKNFRQVKLGEAHHTHAPCPHCTNLPKLIEPRNPQAYLFRCDEYRLSKASTATAPSAGCTPTDKGAPSAQP
jgi:hypothetical protein